MTAMVRSAVPDSESWVSAADVHGVCESWFGIFEEHGRAREYPMEPVWVQTRFGLAYLGERGRAVATSEGVLMAPVGEPERVYAWSDLFAFPDDWQTGWKEREDKAAYRREWEAQMAAEWAAMTPEERRVRAVEAAAYLKAHGD
jgi:hypothetical protein